MNPNRREKKRSATLEEIRETAWKQIREMGAASLSLRGIAREMGVTAPRCIDTTRTVTHWSQPC